MLALLSTPEVKQEVVGVGSRGVKTSFILQMVPPLKEELIFLSSRTTRASQQGLGIKTQRLESPGEPLAARLALINPFKSDGVGAWPPRDLGQVKA